MSDSTSKPFVWGSIPLSDPRQEKFCQLLAVGKLSQTECYKEVYGPGASSSSAASHAAKRIKIVQRVRYLQGLAASAAVMSRAEYIAWLEGLIRTPIDDVDASSPFADGIVRGQVTMPDKLRAGEQLSKLLKWVDEAPKDSPQPEIVAEEIGKVVLRMHGTEGQVAKVLDALRSSSGSDADL